MMRDGLYRIVSGSIVAGFVVKGGKVKRGQCAPVLRSALPTWKWKAEWIGP